MLTYKQYHVLTNESIKHISDGTDTFLKGTVYYTRNHGQFHREGGPAIIFTNGTEIWYLYGQLHRENGPAIVYANGKKDWFVHGSHISKNSWITEEQKWKFLKNDLESIDIIGKPTREMQEYVIKLRPDLINKIDNLDLELRDRYSHEKKIGNVDI